MAHSNIILACMDLYKEVFKTTSELVNCKTWQRFSLRKKLDRCWESSHGTASKHLFLDIFFHDLQPTCHSLRDLRKEFTKSPNQNNLGFFRSVIFAYSGKTSVCYDILSQYV